MEPSDEALMRRYRQGDSDAFDALFVRHARPLYSALCCLLADSEQAVTVACLTWQDVHRQRASYRPPQPFRSWLFALAAQRRREIGRAHSVTARPPGEARPVTDDASLLSALRTLPESYREVVVLHRFVGLAVAEVARVLGATEEAVMQRAQQGESQLALAGGQPPSPDLLPVSPMILDHIARAVLPIVARSQRGRFALSLLLSATLLCLCLVLSLSLFWVRLHR